MSNDLHRIGKPWALGVQWLGLVAIAGAASAYGVHGSIPHNPVHLPFESHFETAALLPEAWNFFTHDAQDPGLVVTLRSEDGRWAEPETSRNGAPANLFGLRRTARAEGVEMGEIVASLAGKEWRPCTRAPELCLEEAPVARVLRSKAGSPLLCGTLGFVRQERVPWAWAKSSDKITMPSEVLRLEVQC